MQVVSAAFFDRLFLEVLKEKKNIAVDELIPFVIATAILLERGESPYHAFAHSSALKLLHEGGIVVGSIDELSEKFPHLRRLEDALASQDFVPRSKARLLVLEWLKERSELPRFLQGNLIYVCDRPVDLSECELQIVFELAKLGVPFRFEVAIDRKGRGLLQPTNEILTQIEKRSNTLPVSVDLVELQGSGENSGFIDAIFDSETEPGSFDGTFSGALSTHFSSQANWVAAKIVELKTKSEAPISVAIALRNFDYRWRYFEESLRSKKLAYKIGAKLSLSEHPEVKVLLRIVREKIDQGDYEEKTFGRFLDEACSLLQSFELQELLRYFSSRLKHCDAKVTPLDFYLWLEALMRQKDADFDQGLNDADAVEFVSVKKINARAFDYVFLVDMAQGRFPKMDVSNHPFKESECHEINKIVGRRVLPVLYEDLLENSKLSTRLGFESMWLMDALLSAKKGVFFTASECDPKGKEEGVGTFFEEVSRLIPVLKIQKNARSVSGNKNYTLAQRGCFSIGEDKSRGVFKRWLGLDKNFPLTPSRLEAFASCPFRTLFERIFGIEREATSKEEIDPRKVGQFVHAVLEQFFRQVTVSDLQQSTGLSSKLRQLIERLVRINEKILTDGYAGSSPQLVGATLLWLQVVLERSISNMITSPQVANVQPSSFEKKIGFSEKKVQIKCGDEDIFIGGIIDRIDAGSAAFAVIDYKMSSAQSLNQKFSAKEILNTHFQLPIYLRLVKELYPESVDKSMYAYLVSVRDGVASSVLGRDMLSNIMELVSDDEDENGLCSSIGRVMNPILSGKFGARENATCEHCHLKAACRIKHNDAGDTSAP